MLTSRHEAGSKVRPYTDTLLEIVGFTRDDAKCFIRKYFQHEQHLAEKLISKVFHASYFLFDEDKFMYKFAHADEVEYEYSDEYDYERSDEYECSDEDKDEYEYSDGSKYDYKRSDKDEDDYSDEGEYSDVDKDLRELLKNPLNTLLLCVIFEDLEGTLPTNRTQLYVEIVLFILRRYESKNGLSNRG